MVSLVTMVVVSCPGGRLPGGLGARGGQEPPPLPSASGGSSTGLHSRRPTRLRWRRRPMGRRCRGHVTRAANHSRGAATVGGGGGGGGLAGGWRGFWRGYGGLRSRLAVPGGVGGAMRRRRQRGSCGGRGGRGAGLAHSHPSLTLLHSLLALYRYVEI